MQDAPSELTTVQRTFHILEHLQESGGASLDEMVEKLALSRSTIHRYLYTLEQQGYVTNNDSKYLPSLKFLTIGGMVRSWFPGYELIQERVQRIANETNERSQFEVEEFGQRVYLFTHSGDHAVQMDARIGKRGYLHTAASGKAILASMPDSKVEHIIDQQGLPAMTDQTITDRDELFAELEEIRERGYAFNREESRSGLNAVGTAVCYPEDRVLGAFSISGPSHRLKGSQLTEDLPDYLLGIANELELNLKYE